MNNYVLLDGLKYMAPHGEFGPIRTKPSTERITLSGRSDVTYGPAALLEWTGSLIAPVTPIDTGWGDIDDLRYTLEKRQGIAFTDHYSVVGVVYAIGPHGERSFTPKWDADSNEFRVQVRLLIDRGGGVIVPLSTLFLNCAPETIATAGGEVTVGLDTLSLELELLHMFTARPINMQEVHITSSAVGASVPQLVAMDTLTLAGSIPTMAVV